MFKFDSGKWASIIAVSYVLFFTGGVFVHFFVTGDTYTLKYSFSLPGTWLAGGAGLLIAWGLWRHFRWSWWLGLIAVIYQLSRLTPRIIKLWSSENITPWSIMGMNVVFALFAAFLIVLILPSTRKVCSR